MTTKVALNYSRQWSSNPGLIEVAGRFETNGAADPSTVYGKGFTVSRIGTGLYKVTLKNDGRWVGTFVQLQSTASGSTERALWTISGGDLVIETQSAAGTAADLDGPWVSFAIKIIFTTLRS